MSDPQELPPVNTQKIAQCRNAAPVTGILAMAKLFEVQSVSASSTAIKATSKKSVTGLHFKLIDMDSLQDCSDNLS